MAYTTINKHTEHFTTTTWTGDSTTPKTFTTGTFKPDWLWGKDRSQSYSHQIYDTTRGAGNDKEIESNTNGAEGASNSETYGYVSGMKILTIMLLGLGKLMVERHHQIQMVV